jgi:hypothetical protein
MTEARQATSNSQLPAPGFENKRPSSSRLVVLEFVCLYPYLPGLNAQHSGRFQQTNKLLSFHYTNDIVLLYIYGSQSRLYILLIV